MPSRKPPTASASGNRTAASDNEPRSAKGKRTRSRLLDAAKTVFEREGFLNARISDIADEAQIAHGSFYHYFDSKESIFREVAELQEQALLSHRESDADASESDTAYERIWRANRAYLEWYRREAKIMGVIEEVSRYDDEVNRARAARQQAFAERSETAIKRLQRDGKIDERVDARFAATALGAMVARVAELWLVQGYSKFTMDQAVNQCTLLWANAIGVEVPDDALERTTTGRK